MSSIIGYLTILSIVILAVGLFKPRWIIKWHKKPTRLQLVIYWLGLFLALVFAFSLSMSDNERALLEIQIAQRNIENKEYANAIDMLSQIDKTNQYYDSAQILIKKVEDLISSSIVPTSSEEGTIATEIASINQKVPNYDIIKEAKNFPFKMSYDIKIDKRLNKTELNLIKNEVIQKAGQADKVFILFYLPGMELDAGAWAKAHSQEEIEIMEYMLEANPTTLKN